MPQIKFSLDEDSDRFVNQYRKYGYKSKSAVVVDAITRLRESLNQKALADSAALYQEIYESDVDLQDLTDDAASLCLE
jgi:Arc/MetJ-type ribon-helix-helix transcriptional regulator